MRFSRGASRTSFGSLLERWFPTPALLAPRSAGIDISDTSIKWLVLKPNNSWHEIQCYGEFPIEAGIVVNGLIKNVDALAGALSSMRKDLRGVQYAHAALPEEAAYVFSMQIPAHTPRQQALRMVEFEFEGRVPIQPSAAVYDYSIVDRSGTTDEISVVVFPKDLAQAYVDAFQKAGITLVSLEVEARSIARAVSSKDRDEPITLVVDFGRARTGFAVVKQGEPIFTSTVDVGGDQITKILTERLKLTPEQVIDFKNREGLLVAGDNSEKVDAIMGTVSALADEIARHYRYWDTRRDEHGERVTPVGRVLLVGGNANLKGLPDYVAGRVQAKTARANVWQHVASFDHYIPPIDKHDSLQYGTAVGLALRGSLQS